MFETNADPILITFSHRLQNSLDHGILQLKRIKSPGPGKLA